MKKAVTLTRSNALFISMFSILLMLFFSFSSLFCYAHTEAEIKSVVEEELMLQFLLISYAITECENSMETLDRYISAWESDPQKTASLKSGILYEHKIYNVSKQENPIDTQNVMLDHVDCDYFAEYFAKNPPKPRSQDPHNTELAHHRSEIDLLYEEIASGISFDYYGFRIKVLSAGYAGLSDDESSNMIMDKRINHDNMIEKLILSTYHVIYSFAGLHPCNYHH